MKNSLHKNLLLFLALIFSGVMLAQDVSGSVSDGKSTISGANVVVKGTKIATGTDFDGKFTLKNIGANAVLVISYIGKKTQEVAVSGQKNVEVVLIDDASDLKEIVVIGYGTVKKKDATGAVDQLNSKKFDNVAAASPAELLRGKVAGVQVTNSSGEPGAATTIRIRGTSSLRTGNGPLIVVDGVPLAGGDTTSGGANINLGSSSAKNPLSFLNQNDIESISILKDASSTAIYGSRGASGVIVVTTKKGKGMPQLTFDTSVQISSYKSKFDVMSADRFAQLSPLNDKGSRDYNWKDAILRTAYSKNYDLAYSTSNENSNTRVSFGVSQNEGIIKNTAMNKYTARIYNSTDFLDKILKIETNLSYSNVKDERTLLSDDVGFVGNLMGAALYWNPTRSTKNPDGSYNIVGTTYLNPVQLLDTYSNNSDLNKLLANVTTTFTISKKLKYQFLLGYEVSAGSTASQLLPTIKIDNVATATNPVNNIEYRGQATLNYDQRVNKTIEHNVTYSSKFGKNIDLNAIVGYSYYDYLSSGSFSSGKGYANSQTNLVDNIEGGIPVEFRSNSYKNLSGLQSFFARTSWSLYEKLLVDLTVRRDGTTKAAAGKKYGTFPSVGVGYKIFSNKEGIVNDLKLRVNYGITGDSGFPVNSTIGIIQYNGPDSFNIVNNASANLTWETTTSSGIGVDFTMVKNRLSGSFDYFNRNTTDLILPQVSQSGQPSSTGIKYTNLDAILNNKGFEIGLNYKAINSENLTLDLSGNAAFLSSNITGLKTPVEVGNVAGQGLSDAFVQTIQNDNPLYTYNILDFQGYDANGDSRYRNPDGTIVTGSGSAQKVVSDKQALPKISAGFNATLSYKSLDLTTSFYGAFGHYIYNNTSNALFNKSSFGIRNVTEEVATSVQNTTDSNAPSTKYLEKGDFIRLGNLTLGYKLSGKFLESARIKSARIFVNGSNLFVITNYSGFDPEVDTNKTRNGVPSAGIDYFSYPRSTNFTFGLNLTF